MKLGRGVSAQVPPRTWAEPPAGLAARARPGWRRAQCAGARLSAAALSGGLGPTRHLRGGGRGRRAAGRAGSGPGPRRPSEAAARSVGTGGGRPRPAQVAYSLPPVGPASTQNGGAPGASGRTRRKGRVLGAGSAPRGVSVLVGAEGARARPRGLSAGCHRPGVAEVGLGPGAAPCMPYIGDRNVLPGSPGRWDSLGRCRLGGAREQRGLPAVCPTPGRPPAPASALSRA